MRLSWLSAILVSVGLLAAQGPPRVDLHVHLDPGSQGGPSLTPTEAAALSKKLDVQFGVLGEGGCSGEIHDNLTLEAFINSLDGQPMWRGMQVYGFDWPKCLSADLLKRLDYIAADALILPDPKGDIRIFRPGVTFDDPEAFMERYVDFTVRVLAQPIQIWANPTFLPESMRKRYDELWTPARMDRVLTAAVRNHVAIEINARYQIPNAAFIRRAKAAGAKFSIGSNQHVHGIGEIDHCLRIAKECGLTSEDFFLPARRLNGRAAPGKE